MIDSEAVRKNRPLVRAVFFWLKCRLALCAVAQMHTVEMEKLRRLWSRGDFCNFAEYETLPV